MAIPFQKLSKHVYGGGFPTSKMRGNFILLGFQLIIIWTKKILNKLQLTETVRKINTKWSLYYNCLTNFLIILHKNAGAVGSYTV